MTGSAQASDGKQTSDGKADFTDIYDRPDPRDYFRTLGALDYEIPQRAHPIFETLLTALRSCAGADRHGPPRVLDLCCSYGVNAALLRCDVGLDDLLERYSGLALADLSPEEVCRSDRAYFAEHLRTEPVQVLGLDKAANAIAYGCRAGLLDDGWSEDLEAADPTPELADRIDGVDLVTSTGGIGYITERTLDRVVRRTRPGRPAPWVAAFVLRQFSYDRISETLARHGLVTEQLDAVTFPQRRFASDEERDAALRAVGERGLDPTGREDAGRYHADFYLARPAADAAEQPLDKLLDGVTTRP